MSTFFTPAFFQMFFYLKKNPSTDLSLCFTIIHSSFSHHPKALTLLCYTAFPSALSHYSVYFKPHAHICSFESSFHRYRMEECVNSLIFRLLESLYINLLIFSSHILTHIHPGETWSQQEAINIPFTYDTR